jgi:dynein heavy chain 1
MLGETCGDWADVRKILAKSDFIPSILSFDGKHVAVGI